jgi:hypothetical protein
MAIHFKIPVLLLALAVFGCNSDSSSPTTPTTTTTSAPAGPSTAIINLTILDSGLLAGGQGNLVGFSFRLQESAGLGANINFIRVEIFRPTGEFVERQEIGSGEIVNQTGTNRLEANESRDMTVIMGFRAAVKKGRIIRLTVGMTDDRGNNQDKWKDYVFG